MKGVFMKKYVSFLSLLLFMLNIYTPALAASVPAVTYTGNDADPNIYSPPNGCIHYQIPNSDTAGTHTLIIDNQGLSILMVAIYSQQQLEPFQVIIILNCYHGVVIFLYMLLLSVMEMFSTSTDMIRTIVEIPVFFHQKMLGLPTSISHVSIVICPDTFSTGQTSSSRWHTISFSHCKYCFSNYINDISWYISILLFLILFGSTF